MKKILLFFSACFLSLNFLTAQDAFDLVYNIFESKCISCHNNSNQRGGLDLEGRGNNLADKKADVFNKLVNVSPSNLTAASAGLKIIAPGRADLSFLFQKINNDLDPWIIQEPNTGQPMPLQGELTNIEKETIRQWILFGADRFGKEFDEKIFEKFYSEGGIKSYPNGPPEAPEPGEGFQIKMGPFYLDESGNINDELEFFTKNALELPQDVEVNRLDLNIASYSHHLIIYNFEDSNGIGLPDGLRLNSNHSDVRLVAAVQEPTDLKLPAGTAFKWKKDIVLDLNGHYINYSPQGIYQAEAYVNIYTQPTGTAIQEMHTELLVNFNIPIPNNGEVITHTDMIISNGIGEIYLWAMAGHTHKYGKNYKVYTRENFNQAELIYDAACPRGVPDCSSPFFDYRHIPTRYFEDLKPLNLDFSNGLIHEAQWVNNGDDWVNFGPTSDDEMMVLVLMFTTDTAGLDVSVQYNVSGAMEKSSVYPTPSVDKLFVELPKVDSYRLSIFDTAGKFYKSGKFENRSKVEFSVQELPKGFYLLKIENSSGNRTVKKFFVQKE